MAKRETPTIRLRIDLTAESALGPGKISLLEHIESTGSLSKAARELGMSYRRAWLLVETMNRSFKEPLVTTLAGGKHGGGTQLTAMGEQVLQRYRQLCAQALAAVQDDFDELGDLLAPPAPSSP